MFDQSSPSSVPSDPTARQSRIDHLITEYSRLLQGFKDIRSNIPAFGAPVSIYVSERWTSHLFIPRQMLEAEVITRMGAIVEALTELGAKPEEVADKWNGTLG